MLEVPERGALAARSAGAAYIAIVSDGAFDSLAPVIRGAIEGAGTTVVTDGHYGYRRLGRQGVQHEAHIVNTPERADEILPWVHVVISNLRVWLLGTFRGVSPKHLPRYLLEFTYRFNCRGIAENLSFYLTRRPSRHSLSPMPDSRLRQSDRHVVQSRRVTATRRTVAETHLG